MSNRFNSFRVKYKNLLEAELERFDTLSQEIFADMAAAGLGDTDSSVAAAKVNGGTKGFESITAPTGKATKGFDTPVDMTKTRVIKMD